jgi:hypothetical protein
MLKFTVNASNTGNSTRGTLSFEPDVQPTQNTPRKSVSDLAKNIVPNSMDDLFENRPTKTWQNVPKIGD